jgi:hypothetical protein
MNENLTEKKVFSELERAAAVWAKDAKILADEINARQMSREFMEVMGTEYAETYAIMAYARGRWAGLREAMRILGREEI